MALTLVATSGASNANSYLTLAEAISYFEGRTVVSAWEDSDEQEALLVMATRLMDACCSPQRIQVKQNGQLPYYRITPYWTGTPTDADVQALAWPRTGMYNRNGGAIAVDVIPNELKYATAELAAHLAIGDRTLDNDQAVQGITSVKAGSVSVSFNQDQVETTKILPDAALFLLVPSWLTQEKIERSGTFAIEVY